MSRFISRLVEEHPYYYNPIAVSMAIPVFFFFAWMPLLVFDYVSSPDWIWLCVILMVFGAVIQFWIKRVVYFLIYDQIVFIFLQVFYSWSLTQLFVWFLGEGEKWIAYILVIGPLSLVTIRSFLLDQRKPERKKMPCGRSGKLNHKTGIVIDQTYQPTSFEQTEKRKKLLEWTIRASPLIAGLAIAFTRGLNITGKLIVLLLSTVFLGTIVAKASGETLSYLVATLRWERKHGKPIKIS